jgi:hypothetical protein
LPSPAPSPPLADDYTFSVDFRGETLTYKEAHRSASMIWTWTSGYRISAGSLDAWRNADGTYSAMTPADQAEIIARAVKYAREVQNVKLIVED